MNSDIVFTNIGFAGCFVWLIGKFIERKGKWAKIAPFHIRLLSLISLLCLPLGMALNINGLKFIGYIILKVGVVAYVFTFIWNLIYVAIGIKKGKVKMKKDEVIRSD